MKRPKNFLFVIVLVSVVAIALAVAAHAVRERRSTTIRSGSAPAAQAVQSPNPVSGVPTPGGTPSAAAQRRAKEFNDATNRFNAPDEQH